MSQSNKQWEKWLNRALVVATFVVVILLATHPELRLLVPFIDAAGIDGFLMLVGAQTWSFVQPVLAKTYRVLMLPAAQTSYWLLIYFSGICGPFTDAAVSARFPARSHLRCG